MEIKEKLKNSLVAAVNGYVCEMLNRFGWNSEKGWWVGNDCTGIYCYDDECFISLQDIIFIVDNNVTKEDFIKWNEYVAMLNEFDITTPNLQSWVKGCPRLSQEEINHLVELRQELYDTAKDYTSKITY